MWLVNQIKSKNESNPAYTFLLTGGTATVVLFLIFGVFFCWYKRARRQEKLRRSQHLESTFAERLASRNSSSKIDVRSTSQSNLNSNDGEKRRPTFSRFFQMWKGLRNSRRKSNGEETQRSVVFTISTEDIFPITQPKQQTQSLHSESSDHVVQMDGFVTHLCDVHRVNEDLRRDHINKSQSLDNDLSALKTRRGTSVEQRSNHEVETPKKDNGIYSVPSGSTSPGNHASDANTSENDGKIDVAACTSKESDIENDSGCGSSIHEIPFVESSAGVVRPSFKSLGGNTASRNELITNTDHDKKHSLSCSSNSFENKTLAHLAESNPYPKAAIDDIVKRYSLSCKRRSQAEEDVFQRLIQLAKEGMSDEALKAFEYAMENAELNTTPILSRRGSAEELFASVDSSKNLPDGAPSADTENTTRVENLLNGQDGIRVIQSEVNHSLHDNTGGRALMANTHDQVDSGVLLSSKNILLSEKQQRSIENGDDSLESALSSEPSIGQASVDGTDSTRSLPSSCGVPVFHLQVPSDVATKASETDNAGKNKSAGEFQARKLKRRNKKQVSFESLPKGVGQHSAHDSSNGTRSLTCDKTSGFSHQITDVVQLERKTTFLSVESLDTGYPFDTGETNRTESSTRENTSEEARTMQSTVVQRTSATKMYTLKVPSLETLHLPSQSSSDKYQKRTRSFSATIRRRISFRRRQSSDDTDVESGSPEREVAKSKQLKAFRSFRVNKKTKSSSIDSQIWDLESNGGNGYRPTFDRIFSEKTEEPVFSDVPFTIPEIGD